MKLKNHTTYDKKILFVTILCSTFEENDNIINQIIEKYKDYLIKNPGICIIFDTRRLNYVNPKSAWAYSNMLSKLNNLAKKNVTCSCVIMQNKMLKDLFNTVIKVHPIVVPFKIISNNQEALNFILEKIKN